MKTCPHCRVELEHSRPQTRPPMGHCSRCHSSFALCTAEEYVKMLEEMEEADRKEHYKVV